MIDPYFSDDEWGVPEWVMLILTLIVVIGGPIFLAAYQ